MADHEKKIAKTLLEIAETVEKLDNTLSKLDDADGKVKHFIEQEKAIHEIKKIIHKASKIEEYDKKATAEWAHRLSVDAEGQDKALANIVKATEKLDEELAKVSDDNGKIKSFIAQKKIIHQVKKILHHCGLYEKFVDAEMDELF